MNKNKTAAQLHHIDKYKNAFFIDKYVALWAYGYLNNFGQSEGLYKTVNELGFSQLDQSGKYQILDVGCGVGRTAADYAVFFKNSEVVGIDDAESMIDMANKINKTDEKIQIDLSNIGFGTFNIDCRQIDNLCFRKAKLLEFYSQSIKNSFDIVTAVNFIDRVADIKQSFELIYDLLKFGGIFIFATPLNFSNSEDWKLFGSFEKLLKLVQSIGFKVEVSFDGLIYKEVLDARGATEEYLTCVMRLVKIK